RRLGGARAAHRGARARAGLHRRPAARLARPRRPRPGLRLRRHRRNRGRHAARAGRDRRRLPPRRPPATPLTLPPPARDAALTRRSPAAPARGSCHDRRDTRATRRREALPRGLRGRLVAGTCVSAPAVRRVRAGVRRVGSAGQAWRVPPKTRRSAAPSGLSWDEAPLAPVVLVRGGEGLLSDRAVARVVAQAQKADPGTEVTRLDAAGYEPGQLEMLASPSLFGEARCIVVSGVESCTDALVEDTITYLRAPADDVTLVLQHGGGVRGKRLLDAVTKAGHPVVVCEPIKRDGDKAAFA